ncbi:MAG: helix-turn-helix transcriptional regulator [Elusimicrobiota bacterium]
MKRKWNVKSQIERKLENPVYRKKFEEDYEDFKIAVQILNALEKKNWSYNDLAKATGTNKSHISRDLKAGGIEKASVGRLAQIAEAMDMTFIPLFVSRHKQKQILSKLHRLVTI